MPDESDRQFRPVSAWKQFLQIELDLVWIHVAAQTEARRQSLNVSIHRPTGYTICDTKHDIGGLAAHSRQTRQFFKRAGNLSLKLFNKRLRAALDILSLGIVISSRANDLLNVVEWCFSESFSVGKALEE